MIKRVVPKVKLINSTIYSYLFLSNVLLFNN